MVVAVAVWSLELAPGKSQSIVPAGDLRITNVALGDELADNEGRTSLKLVYHPPEAGNDSDDEESDNEKDDVEDPVTTVICSLTPSKIEQTTVDLILEAEQEVLFESVGKNTLFITGNYIDQVPPNPYDSEDEDDFDSDSDEDAYGLDEVSSDVIVDPSELDDDSHRFEEIASDAEEAPKDSKKRPRESDSMDVDESKTLSKAQQKKQNKKLKAEGGKAVAAGTEESASAKGEAKKEEKKEKKKEEPKAKKETKELAGGVKVQDHKVGSGPQAKNGDMVSMRYVGKLPNGKIFDQNTKGAPFKFRLGKGEVIKGWDIGIAGMQPGGERLLTIPPAMGYGKKAQSGIPANSTLIFEVKLLKIN